MQDDKSVSYDGIVPHAPCSMPKGIYTLANDAVYDQLVAFLNSIEANVGKDIPVCVIPYDDKLDLVKVEIAKRQNVTLFDNAGSIERWEKFAQDVWGAHPASSVRSGFKRRFGGRTIRKLCSFDGAFEKFVYCDSDSLVMKPFDSIYQKLDSYDLVFDDWEFTKPAADALLKVHEVGNGSCMKAENVSASLHGSYFFGGRKGAFDDLEGFKNLLVSKKEVQWIPPKRIWDEVPLFCYLTIRKAKKTFNFAQSADENNRTGNDARANPFINVNNVLYNQDGLKPIHRIHYMGYSAENFHRLCEGEDVALPHRDVFLHYRFLKEQEKMPKTLRKQGWITKIGRLIFKIRSKVGSGIF